MMLTEETHNHDDSGGYRFEQTHTDSYRCPVSTPANNKRPLENYDPITDTVTPPLPDKPPVDLSTSFSRHRTRNFEKPLRKNVEYYFVDKNLQRKEMNETNNFWLKSLCAQPVAEILGKYRRKSDFQRTRFLWSKMFSTPGEKALLQAWTSNGGHQRTVTSQSRSQPQQLSLSSEMKVYSVRSAGPRRSNIPASPDDLRPHVTSAAGYYPQYSDSRPGSKALSRQSLSRQSPMIRITDGEKDSEDQRDEFPENEVLPNLNGQRKKGQLVLQQRKYFSGNRKHPAIPHVQRLNPVKTEDIAQSADVICLRPTLKSPISRETSRGQRHVTYDQKGSAYSTSEVEKVPYRFPLIISTKNEEDNTGNGEHSNRTAE